LASTTIKALELPTAFSVLMPAEANASPGKHVHALPVPHTPPVTITLSTATSDDAEPPPSWVNPISASTSVGTDGTVIVHERVQARSLAFAPRTNDSRLLVAPFIILRGASVASVLVPVRLTVATVIPATEIEKPDDRVDLFTNRSSSMVTLVSLNRQLV
jgi:hypothetical protein